MGELESNISSIGQAHASKMAREAEFDARLDEAKKSQVRI